MNNELIYIDSNCYMDHFEGRADNLRPLGEFAFNLIRKSMECQYKIIISNLIVEELEFNGHGEKIQNLINDLKEADKIVFVKISEVDEDKARKLKREKNTTLNDTKHAVIANRAGAKFLVTRNMKDYEKLQNLVRLQYPEAL